MTTIIASTTLNTGYNVVSDTTGTLVLQTGATPTTAMTITSGQNVGIGTSSPKGTLDVTSSGAYVPLLLSTTNVGSAAQRNWMISTSWNAYGDLSFVTSNAQGGNPVSAGTTRMMIDPSGNVGIGTSSPSTYGKLSLYGNQASPIVFAINNDNATANTGGILKFNFGTTNTGYLWNYYDGADFVTAQYGAKALTFITGSAGGSERMRIDSSGNLLVGTTSGTSRGVFQSSGNVIAAYTTATANNGICYVGTRDTDGYIGYWIRGATFVGGISITASGTTYATSSDYRLKENVQPMTDALATVAALKPCTYTWKADGSAGQGFIAHELQAVVPDCVTGEKDAVDEEGNPQYQGIDTSFLVATLTAAIQEQQAIIASLTQRIETLEAK